jgi:hypothetical protein
MTCCDIARSDHDHDAILQILRASDICQRSACGRLLSWLSLLDNSMTEWAYGQGMLEKEKKFQHKRAFVSYLE